MVFVSSKEREYLSAVMDADTVSGVRAVMMAWYKAARNAEAIPVTLVIDAYMQANEWGRALQSLTRTYGRDSRAHRFMFEMLNQALERLGVLAGGDHAAAWLQGPQGQLRPQEDRLSARPASA